jgi:8-oxo-dGTP diphosphatase
MNKVWTRARSLVALGGPHIAAVGIVAGNHILTGQRRDNQLWTCPGGHIEPGETLTEGAIREVKEECGIELSQEDLELVDAVRVTSHRTGKAFNVYCFIARVTRERASSKNDPDQEVSQWKWVELEPGTPELIASNRHAKHDNVLCYLGLCSEHADPAAAGATNYRLRARLSGEYTETYAPTRAAVTAGSGPTEGQAIDNFDANEGSFWDKYTDDKRRKPS